MSGEIGSKGGLIAAAGIGVLALLGGFGKVLLKNGDNVARVAARSGDDLARGAGGAFRHADEAGGQFAQNLGRGADDLLPTAPRFADDLPAGGPRFPSAAPAHPVGESLTAVDDLAAREARYAESLGTISPPNGTIVHGTTSTVRMPSAAVRALIPRSQQNSAQRSEQVAALRALQAGTSAVDPQVAAQIAAAEYDRALALLARLHATLEQLPAARLTELAATPSTPQATADPDIVELTKAAQRSAAQGGGQLLKTLLKSAQQQFHDAHGGNQFPATGELTDSQLAKLRRELGRTLSAAGPDLDRVNGSLADESQLFAAAARLTRLRVELHGACQSIDRSGDQLLRELPPQN